METEFRQIMETLEDFYKEDAGMVVEYMESMLYDWYQHYALEHYQEEHVQKVVNGAFRVNDLLLKLGDALRSLKEAHDLQPEPPPDARYDYRFAS